MCTLYFILIINRVYIMYFLTILQYSSTTFTDFIPNYKKENKINKLEKQIDVSNLKNKNLDNENIKLKDMILNKENEIKIMKDEVNK